jgi:hypothetical protein
MRASTIGPFKVLIQGKKTGRVLAMAILFEKRRRHLMHKVSSLVVEEILTRVRHP